MSNSLDGLCEKWAAKEMCSLWAADGERGVGAEPVWVSSWMATAWPAQLDGPRRNVGCRRHACSLWQRTEHPVCSSGMLTSLRRPPCPRSYFIAFLAVCW